MKQFHLAGKLACALIATVVVISGCQKKEPAPPVPEVTPAPATTPPPATPPATEQQPNPNAPTQTPPPATTEPPPPTNR